jgi:NADH dehydrogenase FAD-containing subunit
MGIMAYLGNWNAILQTDGGDISGRAAWFIWRGAYLTKSVSWRNKILIPTYCKLFSFTPFETLLTSSDLGFLNWLFGRDISRF